MNTFTEEPTGISDELWRTWEKKDKLREQASARRLKAVLAVVLGLVAAGLYLLAVR